MPKTSEIQEQSLLEGELMATRRAVVHALADAGGSMSDPSGRVTAPLFEAAGLAMTSGGRSDMLKCLDNDGWILRDTRAKRTYEIVLCDDHPQVAAILAHRQTEAHGSLVEAMRERGAVHEEEPERPEVVERFAADQAAGIEALTAPTPDADAVADAILRRVARLLDLDPDAGNYVDAEAHARALEDREEIVARLGVTVEENQRLRTRLRDVQDELIAVRAERDGLRQQKRQLQENLKAAVRENGGVVDHEVRRRIEAFMRETPTAR